MSGVRGLRLLRAVKESAGAEGPALSLPVGRPVEAILRPVATQRARLDANDVDVLTRWRNRFVTAFLTEFTADDERTARWLTQMVGPDDTRILFMVDAAQEGRTVGYMGLAFIDWDARTGEVDAIVRGEETAPGLMARSMRTLVGWAQGQLGLRDIGVRVRSDNSALEFYRKFGFQERNRVTLLRVEEPGMTRWVEQAHLPPGEPSLVHMTLADRQGSRGVSHGDGAR